jgi:sporulation protein YlmC with PRC-barrel domain
MTQEMFMSQPAAVFLSPVKASKIFGLSVFNSQGDRMGEIKDFVIDQLFGEVSYVVMSFAGFLGLGEKWFAIPFSAFTYNLGKNEYILNIPMERLEKAPGFDADRWPRLSDEKWNFELYKYYGSLPYWE